MNKRIAILYICTGKYKIFWKDFYKASERYFLINCQKEYFAFTDSKKIYNEKHPRIHKVFQKKIGWPFDTLLRFKMFLTIEEELKQFDYLFFLNANMRFITIVDESILPKEEEKLLAVQHPGYFNKQPKEFPVETNMSSKAYIEPGTCINYFMGGFNGGKTKYYLELIKEVDFNIQADLKKKIIAIWHDESHLNKYLIGKNIKILSPSYGFAEGWDLPFEPKILILDKSSFGGHNWLRDNKRSLLAETIYSLKNIIKRQLQKTKQKVINYFK